MKHLRRTIKSFLWLPLILGVLFKPVGTAGAAIVKIQSGKLTVDGKLFLVKGICYSPVFVGYDYSNYDWWADPKTYGSDFPSIKAMNANTIRVYDAASATKEALDAAYQNNLYVIMGYWVDPSANLSDSSTRNNLKTGFVSMVSKWKSHPAILMWSFGNEVDRNRSLSEKTSWYTLLNEAAVAAHNEEGANYHPVTTANEEIGEIGEASVKADDGSLTALDVWGVNVYRGASFGSSFLNDLAGKTAKPFYLSEWGCDAYNGTENKEDQVIQDRYVRQLWSEIASFASGQSAENRCIGGTVFEWCDEWWKGASAPGNLETLGNGGAGGDSSHDTAADWNNAGYSDDPNMNEEWWGITSVSPWNYVRSPRLAYFSLKDAWSENDAVPVVSGVIFQDDVRNYPNPFVAGSEPTRIRFNANGTPRFEIAVFDLSGNKICDLPEIYVLNSGRYRVDWWGKDETGNVVAAGLYVCRIKAATGEREETKYRKIAVVK